MSPDHKVFVIDDEALMTDLLSRYCALQGDNVVGSAETLQVALEALPQLLPEFEADVLVLDANLKRGVHTGEDAQTILAAMTELNLLEDITVIGFSGSKNIEGVHFNVSKPDARQVAELIASLI